MPKIFKCITCGSMFERTRPDQNSQKRCSVLCRWSAYVSVPADVQACWEWIGAKAKSGYGVLRVDGKVVTAHRLSLMLHGVDIAGESVLHSCDNQACVNPLHLRTGSAAENNKDIMDRKRHVWFRWSDEEKQVWLQKVLQGQSTFRQQRNCA